MKINSLIVDGQYVIFKKRTLIYSEKNSKGKTTLLRLILFAMGFPIPSTKGVNFEKATTQVEIERGKTKLKVIRKNGIVKIFQNGEYLEDFDDKEFTSIEAVIFGVSNEMILNNILATFYFDQEKGWTLLNRGKVIGSIQFSIEKYLEGIGSKKLDEYHSDVLKLTQNINFYSQLKKIVSLNDDAGRNVTNLNWDGYKEHENSLRTIELQIRRINDQIKQLNSARVDNEKLVSLLSNLNIMVRTGSGEKIKVSKNNIVNFKLNQSMIDVRLVNLRRQLREKEGDRRTEQNVLEKLNLFDLDSKVDRFRESLFNLNMTPESIEGILSELKKQRKETNSKIKNIINASGITTELYKLIEQYAKVLGVEKYIDRTNEFILTSNLKRYSGAILHLIVFAYRMALLKLLEKNTEIKPPIIIDSPLSGELDQGNAKRMFKLLSSEFSDYQIIVASIDKLENMAFSWDKQIVMKNNLFDTLDNIKDRKTKLDEGQSTPKKN